MKISLPHFGRRTKKHLQRVLSLLVTVCLCLSMLPQTAEAWKILSHVNSADLILLELQRSQTLTGKASITINAPYENGTAYTYQIPDEYWEALRDYPNEFRAGSMGPDLYPDLLTGQGYIHPYYEKTVEGKTYRVGSGEWIKALCDSVNCMPRGNDRKKAIAFTLGYMLHYCGDQFGHDFINCFAGGTYPDLSAVNYSDTKDKNLNIILSHMSEESFMDGLVNWSFLKANGYLNTSAPTRFVADSMLYNGISNNGEAGIFKNNYHAVPEVYRYLISLRMKLYRVAEENRTSTIWPVTGAVQYLDQWIEDLDNATYEFVKCFDRIGTRLINDSAKPDTLGVVKDELQKWVKDYGRFITPTPDILIKGLIDVDAVVDWIIKAVGAEEFIKSATDWIEGQILDIALSALGFFGLRDVIKGLTDRMDKPDVQLDHSDNPFMSDTDNYKEFKEFMDRYAAEQSAFTGKSISSVLTGTDGGALDNALDSDLEAFYNTLVMFKLILIGPDNYTNFIKTLSGVDQTSYTKNTVNLTATSLDLYIHTMDRADAGTDDNIFAEVYQNNTLLISKLLDKPGYDDFERNDYDTYSVELTKPVRIDQLEVKIVKKSKATGSPDWDCDYINIMPVHAGANLLPRSVACGGKEEMENDQTWELHFHDELMDMTRSDHNQTAVTRVIAKIKTKDKESWTDTYGTNDTVYLDVYRNSKRVKMIKLDKPAYDDFEMGDDDEYDVSLSYEGNKGIPLNELSFTLRLDGSNAWTFTRVNITPYHGDTKIADTTVFSGEHELEKSEYSLGKLSSSTYPQTPVTLSYITDVDDGAISFMDSLDDSRQWENASNLLWSNTTVRSKVFFSIFKGFSPKISTCGKTEILQGKSFSLAFPIEGVWNGVRRERRDQIKKIPEVNGSAKLSFINSDGNVQYTADAFIRDGKIQLNNYTNTSLAGTYDIRVEYIPDANDPQYAGSAETFEDVLTVIPRNKVSYTATFKVVNGSWNNGQSRDTSITRTGFEGDTITLSNRISYLWGLSGIPTVGNKPNDGYKEGSWDKEPSWDTELTEDTTFTYTYAPINPISQTVTFKVVNGTWDDGTTDDVTVTLNGIKGDTLKLSASDIPAVGNKPGDAFKAGAWDAEPDTESAVTTDKTYTYTYAAKKEISQTVTFKVVNGSWDDGTTADKTVTIKGLEGDTLKLTANDIPAVGNKPGDAFKAGAWDAEPDTESAVTTDKTYTYTYAAKKEISQTVTFKVVNGSWDDGTTADKTVTIKGLEGDTLKLTANDIPAVGNKPADTFKEGSWDTDPDTESAVTADKTYTYTYAAKEEISQKVTFTVVNGSWDDGTTADKTVTLKGLEGDTLKLSAGDIPAVGNKPCDTFKAGKWSSEPNTESAVTTDKTYTYTYAPKDEISQKVTFTVVNGSWDDGTTADKTVTLKGLEGDTLKLSEGDIPAVGNKPADTFKTGKWSSVPNTETAVTTDKTYTYTYAPKDEISQTVTFKVVNGSWDDGTTADKTVTIKGLEGDTLKLSAGDIPAVGNKPADTFKAGAWDTEPDTESAVTTDKTYTYTYAPKDEISQKVTFTVVNGSWDDGTTADKTVTLKGLEGDTLKLSANDIPAVGNKPGDTFKAGKWSSEPNTESAVTADKTYTYTYAPKDEISQKVTFTVVNDSWDDGTTADKTVTLKGLEGDTLKLSAGDIPAVGNKPADTFKAGAWDTEPDTESAVTADKTYTYTYTAKDKLVVKFDVDGGTPVESKTVYSGETVAAPDTPEKKGYCFTGWFADEEHTVPFDFSKGIVTDTVIYAGWEDVTYTASGDTKHTKGSDSDCVITVKRSHEDDTCFSHFKDVEIDGQLLENGTDYTAAPGSTVITLKAAMLNELSEGDHVVTVLFDDGQAEASLTVKAPEDSESDSEADSDSESEADSDSESEADSNSESETDPDSESEADSDSESEADPDSESDADPDSESEGGSENKDHPGGSEGTNPKTSAAAAGFGMVVLAAAAVIISRKKK